MFHAEQWTVMRDVKNWIKSYEGFRAHPYLDTVHKLTIGWGRNLEDVGLSMDEANHLFDNDFNRCEQQLSEYSWYQNLSKDRKEALIHMCFNLGITHLLQFKRMIQALIDKDFTLAAKEALNSKWAQQMGIRAQDIALVIRQGHA